MSKIIIIISVICVVAALGVVAAIALSGVGITLTLENQNSQDNPGSNPLATQSNNIQTPVPTKLKNSESETVPTAVITPTINPAQNVNPTVAPTAEIQLTELQKEGIAKLVGNWHGTESMFFVGNGEFNAVCTDDFNAVISGTITAMGENYEFNLPVVWEYIGNNQFKAVSPDNTIINFTCDGSKLNLVVNPYELNLIDNSMADIDFSIDLYKV